MGLGWPVTLTTEIPSGLVVLRPLTKRDKISWLRMRAANRDWLQPWEATSPVPLTRPGPRRRMETFEQYIREMNNEARAGELLPFAIEFNGELSGQLTVSSIQYGSLWSGAIGYWVSQHIAGRGVMPTAVAMATDYCFSVLGLHRIEINIRPENDRSLRVVSKLGFRDEGVRRAYLHIQGQWADHRTFALVQEDVPEGVLNRYFASAFAP